jgi:hypothetical protein
MSFKPFKLSADYKTPAGYRITADGVYSLHRNEQITYWPLVITHGRCEGEAGAWKYLVTVSIVGDDPGRDDTRNIWMPAVAIAYPGDVLLQLSYHDVTIVPGRETDVAAFLSASVIANYEWLHGWRERPKP